MSLKINALAVAVLVSFAAPAMADEDAVNIAYTILQSTAVKTKSAGGDVILPNGWVDDRQGYQHVRFIREWNHLPVRGGDIVMTLDPNDVLVDTTQTYVPLTISKNPVLKDKDAIFQAGLDFGSGFTNKPSARLVVYTYVDGSAELAYEVLLTDASRSIMYTVDAGDGHLLGKWNWAISTSNQNTDVDLGSVPADEHCLGPAIPADTPTPLDIWFHLRQQEDYQLMFMPRPTGESGALIEATADINGTFQEMWRAQTVGGTGNYLFGERHPMFGTNPGLTHAIRWLFDPQRDGVSRNCYVPNIGSLDPHAASGVGNRFFYLLAEGTGHKIFSGVDHYAPTCNGDTFAGIGSQKAYEIWMNAGEGYMTSVGDYKQMRQATIKATRELHGQNSVEEQAVLKAWAAVGVN